MKSRPVFLVTLISLVALTAALGLAYGMQAGTTNGKSELYPIEDGEHVDARRAAVGLPGLDEPQETRPQATREHRIIPIAPMSQDVEVLYGDPNAVGEPFVIRIRELPGGIIPPHRHPVDEHITVVQGTIYFGVGEKFDRAAATEMKAGSYAFIPKGSTMFGYTPEAAIVQVHGVGPFHIHWRAGNTWRDSLKTLDDPDSASVFKFKKGERVIARRGTGRIRQGYDSGEVIGYEIEGEDGTLFIAEEGELRRAGKD